MKSWCWKSVYSFLSVTGFPWYHPSPAVSLLGHALGFRKSHVISRLVIFLLGSWFDFYLRILKSSGGFEIYGISRLDFSSGVKYNMVLNHTDVAKLFRCCSSNSVDGPLLSIWYPAIYIVPSSLPRTWYPTILLVPIHLDRGYWWRVEVSRLSQTLKNRISCTSTLYTPQNYFTRIRFQHYSELCNGGS